MSIRIQNDPLPGSSVSELSRPVEIASTSSAASRQTRSVGAIDGDQVELSGLSGSISDNLSTAAAEHSDKVRHLAALYASGRYEVNSASLSRAMISQAIGGTDA